MKNTQNFEAEIVVVGAGAAGLYLTYLLRNQGVEVVLLEASERTGGRICSLPDFADFPAEAGAEEIHGERSLLAELLNYAKEPYLEAEGETFFFDGKNTGNFSDGSETGRALEQIGAVLADADAYEGGPISLDNYLAGEGIGPEFLPAAGTFIAPEYGADAEQICAAELAGAERLWTAGERNFLLTDKTLQAVFEEQFPEAFEKIYFKAEVKEVDYSGDKTTLLTRDGRSFSAKKVVLTVPLGILQAGLIRFVPELPAAKTAAFQTIGFGPGAKVILRFSERFWADDALVLRLSEAGLQFWTSRNTSEENTYLTTILAGKNGVKTAGRAPEDTVDFLITELQHIFPDYKIQSLLIDFALVDWSVDPFVRGLYSYASPGSGAARLELARPVKDRLFFAGEAAHTGGHFATVHGAMETAETTFDLLHISAETA